MGNCGECFTIIAIERIPSNYKSGAINCSNNDTKNKNVGIIEK